MRGFKKIIRYSSYFFVAVICSTIASYATSVVQKGQSHEFSNSKPILFESNTAFASHFCDPMDPSSTGDSTEGDDDGDGGH